MINYTLYERNDVLQLRINGGKHNHNIRFSLGVKVSNLKFNLDKARCQSTSEAAIKTNILIRDIEECIEKAALLPKDDLTLETLKDQVLSIVKPLNQRIETRNGYLLCKSSAKSGQEIV
jgi:hypothetical protein